MSVEIFGHMPDGSRVEAVTLRGGGLTANVLTYGGVLRDLRLADHAPPLVIGFPHLDDYLTNPGFFGATVGRCANRIGGAAFTLDGRAYTLDPNEGRNHLHGGRSGTGARVWTLDDVGDDHVDLSILLDDGEMGYPGAMRIALCYALLPQGTLDIRMRAETDRPTLCNLAHHSYFNLDGDADILGHRLTIAADCYLPVDAALIPTGTVAPVAGTPFDFRTGRPLRDACAEVRLDHNFCLSPARGPLREVARLKAGAVAMTVRTTEPGLQVFDAAPFNLPARDLAGRRIGAHAGIALEPQVWPDAIHHADWPQPVLRPGQTYLQHTQFAFSLAKA